MKTIQSVILILILIVAANADDSITVEQFKHMTYVQQMASLDQAPPGIKAELLKIFRHETLLNKFGGEDGLKMEKERQRINARGLLPLDNFYDKQVDLSNQYLGRLIEEKKRAGIPLQKVLEMESDLITSCDLIRKRYPIVHQLIFRLKASPNALGLAKSAEMLNDQVEKEFGIRASEPIPITKEKLQEIDREADQMYEEIKKLPSLTPEQVQEEYDAIPDEKVQLHGL